MKSMTLSEFQTRVTFATGRHENSFLKKIGNQDIFCHEYSRLKVKRPQFLLDHAT